MLAYDEWGGSSVLPEMLASFITPNHPAIFTILKRASELLHTWTGDPSLDKYFSRDPDRVKKQMAAIYSAITEQQIVYVVAPASFEQAGQRVRMVDNLLSNKMGNCLEMTLLYAACLEAVGIHPIVVFDRKTCFCRRLADRRNLPGYSDR
ncbi:MAG: hypothetical protein LIP01_00445 [Tannerellaceae bacterium]|nr:hypothetical protein [Tannerellaceae bacterium]